MRTRFDLPPRILKDLEPKLQKWAADGRAFTLEVCFSIILIPPRELIGTIYGCGTEPRAILVAEIEKGMLGIGEPIFAVRPACAWMKEGLEGYAAFLGEGESVPAWRRHMRSCRLKDPFITPLEWNFFQGDPELKV